MEDGEHGEGRGGGCKEVQKSDKKGSEGAGEREEEVGDDFVEKGDNGLHTRGV